MDISHLLPMVEGQPNEDLVRSLGVKSAFLHKQSRDFPKTFDFHDSEIVCFYETLESPTATKVYRSPPHYFPTEIFQCDGKWQMSGPPTILVSRFSAMHSRPHEAELQNARPINKAHSDMVKFTDEHDNDYQIALGVLRRLSTDAQKVVPRLMASAQGKNIFLHSNALSFIFFPLSFCV